MPGRRNRKVLSFQQASSLILKSDQSGVCDLAHGALVKPHKTSHCISPLATGRYIFYALSMFGKPRQLESEAELREAAIKILMRRAHSVSEMKKALARRCEDEKLVKAVVERLKSEKLLDDARYAKQFTRQRTITRKQGQYRVARDLRARGVPDRHIETALKDVATETDPSAMIRQRIERKLRLFRGEIDDKKLASMYRSLMAAGFPADLIRRELHRATHEEIPEVDVEVE